jgi:hypothetical protein
MAAKLSDGESANKPPTPGSANAAPGKLVVNISNTAMTLIAARKMHRRKAPMGRMLDSNDAWQMQKRVFRHQSIFTALARIAFSQPQRSSSSGQNDRN